MHPERERRLWLASGIGLALCIGLALPDVAHSQPASDPLPIGSEVRAGLEALYRGDETTASELLDACLASDPDDPMARLFRLKRCWWGILEGRDASGELQGQLKADLEFLRQGSVHHGQDVVWLYALGEAYCATGRLAGISGSAWEALRAHQKGSALLRQALERQPDLVPARISLGVYRYYAARTPAFLRFVAKLLRIDADRDSGLQDLRRAADTPGWHRPEAIFFLVEILDHMEGDALSALPYAREMHLRYPRHVGFRMKLADVLFNLERVDLAEALLDTGGSELEDPEAAIQCRFLHARLLADSGRTQAALAILDSLSSREIERVTWLPSWFAYYRGRVLAQLGRREEASAVLVAAEELADIAGSRGLVARERARLPTREAEIEALAARVVHEDAAADELARCLDNASGLDAPVRQMAGYALGVAALRREAHATAVQHFEAVAEEDAEPCWTARARIRSLQALLWAGRIEEARRKARKLRSRCGEVGAPPQLEWLIEECLSPSPAEPGFAETSTAGMRRRFYLRDTGFTSVEFEWWSNGGQRVQRLRYVPGGWVAEIPVPCERLVYGFRVQGRQHLVDPEARDLVIVGSVAWSVLDLSVAEEPDPSRVR